jgi:hypothetical protein
MGLKIKTLLLFPSITLNLLFILALIFSLSGNTASLSFHDPGTADRPAVTAALIVAFPRDSGTVAFNAVDITLETGRTASLQFSALTDRRQANWLITALYDHRLISVSPTGFGILITALSPGETLMRALTDDGFKDIARVRVTE